MAHHLTKTQPDFSYTIHQYKSVLQFILICDVWKWVIQGLEDNDSINLRDL
jgi:hypothetical protein